MFYFTNFVFLHDYYLSGINFAYNSYMNNSEKSTETEHPQSAFFALKAEELINSEHFTEAEEILRSGIAEFPDYFFAYLLLEKALKADNKIIEADSVSARITRLFGNSRYYSLIKNSTKAEISGQNQQTYAKDETNIPAQEAAIPDSVQKSSESNAISEPDIDLNAGSSNKIEKENISSEADKKDDNPFAKYKNMKGFTHKLASIPPPPVFDLSAENSGNLALVPGLNSNPILDKSVAIDRFGLSTDSLPNVPEFGIDSLPEENQSTEFEINNQNLPTNPPAADNSNEIKKSESPKKSMVTETLANIFISQGAFKEAIAAFKALMKNASEDKKQHFEEKIADTEAKLAEFEALRSEETKTKNKSKNKRKSTRKGKSR